jgi:hypothetical protein
LIRHFLKTISQQGKILQVPNETLQHASSTLPPTTLPPYSFDPWKIWSVAPAVLLLRMLSPALLRYNWQCRGNENLVKNSDDYFKGVQHAGLSPVGPITLPCPIGIW